MDGLDGAAELALDLAAPVEGAGAPFDDDHLLGAVSTAAAHEVASVDADAGLVALTTVRSLDAEARVALAEAWRRLQVDQVLGARRLVVRVVGPQLKVVAVALGSTETTVVAQLDARGAVEAVLEVVADHAEVGQPHPACPNRARTRHAVALALLLHLRHHVLRTIKKHSKQLNSYKEKI